MYSQGDQLQSQLVDLMIRLADLERRNEKNDAQSVPLTSVPDTAFPSAATVGTHHFRTDTIQDHIYDGTVWRGPQIDHGSAFPSTTGLPTPYQFFRDDLGKFFSWNGTRWQGGQPDSGTAFPTPVPTNYQFFRTDLGEQYWYDGTRWRGAHTFDLAWHTVSAPAQPFANTATGTTSYYQYTPAQDTYVLKGAYYTYVQNLASGNNATNYWTVTLMSNNGGTTLGSFNTSADTVATNATHTITPNAVAVANNLVQMSFVPTGTPGPLYVRFTVRGQAIAV